MVSLSWNMFIQREKKKVYDAQMRKNANPVYMYNRCNNEMV